MNEYALTAFNTSLNTSAIVNTQTGGRIEIAHGVTQSDLHVIANLCTRHENVTLAAMSIAFIYIILRLWYRKTEPKPWWFLNVFTPTMEALLFCASIAYLFVYFFR